MRLDLWKKILCAGCLLVAGLAGWATPLQRADIAADPIWVLHLDCDTLRPTQLGQFLLSEMDKPDARSKLDAFQAMFNFDPRKQLHGLTLYCAGSTPSDGVLLVYADFEAERLVTLARAAKEYQSSEHQGHTVHSWIDENKKPKNGVQPRVYAAIQGSRVLFGQRASAVSTALDVLDRRVPNLSAGKNFSQLGASGTKSFLQGAARKLDFPEGDPNAAILKLAQRLRLDVGEVQQQVSASLSLEANDPDVAKHMTAIAQGLIALMKLQKEKPEAVKLAEALAVNQEGPGVVVSLKLPASDILEVIKADAARKAEKRAGEK